VTAVVATFAPQTFNEGKACVLTRMDSVGLHNQHH